MRVGWWAFGWGRYVLGGGNGAGRRKRRNWERRLGKGKSLH
jgi:hypothetical protein